jgi:hypothetical protein
MARLSKLLLLGLGLCCLGSTWIASPGKGSHASGSSVVPITSDDFNRANGNLGANWTVYAADPDIQIASNVASVNGGGFAENVGLYTGQPTSTVNQYVKGTYTSNNASNRYPMLVVRATNAASPMYKIYFYQAEDKVTWNRATSSSDGAFVEIQNAAMTVNTGDSFGVTITGTGNATVVRIWRNPVASQPISATEWDSGDSPTLTFTNDPTTPVDTGNVLGMGGEHDGATGGLTWDNFSGGSL